ncbi:GTP-binding protein 1 [Pelomyxa schiedti]|nr:GTP-binding protein 1 [Pelomyxa schiedti]
MSDPAHSLEAKKPPEQPPQPLSAPSSQQQQQQQPAVDTNKLAESRPQATAVPATEPKDDAAASQTKKPTTTTTTTTPTPTITATPPVPSPATATTTTPPPPPPPQQQPQPPTAAPTPTPTPTPKATPASDDVRGQDAPAKVAAVETTAAQTSATLPPTPAPTTTATTTPAPAPPPASTPAPPQQQQQQATAVHVLPVTPPASPSTATATPISTLNQTQTSTSPTTAAAPTATPNPTATPTPTPNASPTPTIAAATVSAAATTTASSSSAASSTTKVLPTTPPIPDDDDDLAALAAHFDRIALKKSVERDSNSQAQVPVTGVAENMEPEPQSGNIEYKLKLIDPTPLRFEHLVTQLKWRLGEGNGEAIYEIGVEDNGVPAGLSEGNMDKSLATLKRMTEELHADMTILRKREGVSGQVAEVLVRQFNNVDCLEIRVAVVGNVDSGKSTLLGVLSRGTLDNGRGLARLNIFRHKHEIETGRTSSIGHEVLGFDSKGECVNYGKAHGSQPSHSDICKQSCKVINFIDLAGHEKYLRTTLFGLTGHAPDFAMLTIGSNMGVIGMTKEHLGIALALRVPVFIVVTKIDMCPENVMNETLTQIKKILKSPGARKIPFVVKTKDDIIVCARNFLSERIAPIFCVSNVTGVSLDLLRMFLNLLPASRDWEKLAQEPLEFHIDADWAVTGVGTVASGTLLKGSLECTDKVLLGPDQFGNFNPILIKSIHTKRMAVKQVKAGQTASVAIKKLLRKDVRKGMVIVPFDSHPTSCVEFEADILVLYHATTIALNYEAVIHCNAIKQCARIVRMVDSAVLRTGDRCKVIFRFLYWPEFLSAGSRLIFREGHAKGIGRVVSVIPYHGGQQLDHKSKKLGPQTEKTATTTATTATPSPTSTTTTPTSTATTKSDNPGKKPTPGTGARPPAAKPDPTKPTGAKPAPSKPGPRPGTGAPTTPKKPTLPTSQPTGSTKTRATEPPKTATGAAATKPAPAKKPEPKTTTTTPASTATPTTTTAVTATSASPTPTAAPSETTKAVKKSETGVSVVASDNKSTAEKSVIPPKAADTSSETKPKSTAPTTTASSS